MASKMIGEVLAKLYSTTRKYYQNSLKKDGMALLENISSFIIVSKIFFQNNLKNN